MLDRPDATVNAADQQTEKMAREAIEEARMVLPGIQALFSFQLMAVFNQRFNELTAGPAAPGSGLGGSIPNHVRQYLIDSDALWASRWWQQGSWRAKHLKQGHHKLRQ